MLHNSVLTCLSSRLCHVSKSQPHSARSRDLASYIAKCERRAQWPSEYEFAVHALIQRKATRKSDIETLVGSSLWKHGLGESGRGIALPRLCEECPEERRHGEGEEADREVPQALPYKGRGRYATAVV